MYERMLDKNIEPDVEQIGEFLGLTGVSLLRQLEAFMSQNYRLVRQLCMPFGKNYGWGYKYSHGTKPLCNAFFERSAVTVSLQLVGREVSAVETRLNALMPKTQALWKDRENSDGSDDWFQYRVLNDEELNDIIELVKIKKKPVSQ